MQQSNPYLIRKIFKKIKFLLGDQEEKTSVLSESISFYLRYIPELKKYINENNPDNESKILFEVAKYLKYSKYQKGHFIKHSYDLDNFFYMIFYGEVAKFDIQYNRLYLSFIEYLTYLIKLRLLGEKSLYLKCIRKNKKVFPFDEKMDLLTTEDIKIDHYQDLIKKIKNEIKNSSWFSNKYVTNKIQDFLDLYNPKIINIKEAFLGKETKYPTYLPFFIFDKIMEPISFVGQLTKPKGIKLLSAYVCLNMSDIFYIDKTKIEKNNNLFNLFQRRVTEDVIKKLFEGHFFFKDTNESFLIKNYSKYFYVQKYYKGEKLIKQNTPYEGIYFINSGVFQLKSLRSYNELNDLHFSILHALDSFPKAFMDYQSKINDLDKNNNKNKYKNIYEGLNPNQISKFTELKDISFKVLVSPDVVGLNDIYDNKTGLNNFSVECISEEAEVFFLPREIVTSMLTEDNINNKMGEFIGKQCMLLITEINKYKESFENSTKFEISNYKDTNYNRFSFNLKKPLNARKENSKNTLLYLIHKKNSGKLGNISKIISNCSTNKSKNMSNTNYTCFNGSTINNQSLNILKHNTRYDNFPDVFSIKITNNNKDNILKTQFKPERYKNDKHYKTCFNFYKSKTKKNTSIKTNMLYSQNDFLTDRTKENEKNNINEDDKNTFSQVINDISKTNYNNNKVNGFLNKTHNKGILKKFSSYKKSHKNVMKFNNYESNSKILKSPLACLKSASNKKKIKSFM